MKVICISGKAGAGKDTYAGYLAEELKSDGYKVLVTHYADLLKYVCTQFFGWNGEKDERGRWMLQYIGTDVVRKKDKDFWANALMNLLCILKDFAEWDYVIIPDTRFKNEISIVADFGFPLIHIRIERPEYDAGLTDAQKNHQSETDLDDENFDLIIDNSGTLRDLYEAANTTVVWMTGEHQLKMEEFYGV